MKTYCFQIWYNIRALDEEEAREKIIDWLRRLLDKDEVVDFDCYDVIDEGENTSKGTLKTHNCYPGDTE